MSTKPTPSKLFISTGSIDDVVLNWYGHPADKFYPFATEYHYAARRLVDHSRDSELRDIGACPVVFLYRHSLELLLKEILMTGRYLGSESLKPDSITDMGHDLRRLWDACKSLLRGTSMWEEWSASLADHENVIVEFAKIDAGSFSFRYPISKNGTRAALAANRPDLGFAFNLKHFCQTMDELLLALHRLSWQVETEVQGSQEQKVHQFGP